MNTVSAKQSEVKRRWLLVDAKDQTLGRLASEVAKLLRGKHNPMFTPHVDTGDFVVVVNAEKVRLTGNKWSLKMYRDYSGYPGGLKERNAAALHQVHPTDLIRRAVKGMLPRGPMGFRLMKKLKIQAGSEHPHQAQKPEPVVFEGKKS
jgi:large subunit ribosomal protein L13